MFFLSIITSCGDNGTVQCQPRQEFEVQGPVLSDESHAFLVDAAQYQADVEFIAQPRPPASDHYYAVQHFCAERLSSLGYDVEYHNYGSGTNVIGVKRGIKMPEKHVVVSAHYDAIGDCPGADDNASGVAGVLETARILAAEEHDKTLVLACWDEEEAGRLGSKAFVQRARENNSDIEVSFVYEMIGYKSDEPNSQTIPTVLEFIYPEEVSKLKANNNTGDFILLASDDSARQHAFMLSEMANQKGLPLMNLELSCRDKTSFLYLDLRRSDHGAFWEHDYPAIMITDTADYRNPHYHCGDTGKTDPNLVLEDTVEHLDFEFATKVVDVVTSAVKEALVFNGQ